MKILKYTILALICWLLPSFLLMAVGPGIGSATSYMTFGLLLLYFFLREKKAPAFPFIILGMFYFIISALIYLYDFKQYYLEFVKFIIMIVGGSQLARDTTKKELFYIILLGTLSILIHATLFQDGYGRYSGFYLNPNGAGFVCIIGYGLSITLQNKKLKYIGLFVCTLAGLLTFSRTFLVLWLLINLISVFVDKKNLTNVMIGIGALVLVFSFAAMLQVNSLRLTALNNVIENKSSTGSSSINQDSRTKTWAKYYDMIYNRPIFGNGYLALSGSQAQKQGVHNSYLLAIGEAGIIPFLLMVFIYCMLMLKSLRYFYTNSEYLYLSIALALILMVTHTYFKNYIVLFISLWLYLNMKGDTKDIDLE